MARAKAPLTERDANVVPKSPSAGKRSTQAVKKSAPSSMKQSDLDVASDIALGRGQKRGREEDSAVPAVSKLKSHESGFSVTEGNESSTQNSSTQNLKYNCDDIRGKIREVIESKEFKVGEFQKRLGVSSSSYQDFMKQKGSGTGLFSKTFEAAHQYFLEQDEQGAQTPRAKRAKTNADPDIANANANVDTNQPTSSSASKKASDNSTPSTTNTAKSTSKDNATTKKSAKKDTAGKDQFDVSDITLPDEHPGPVPVFDTCDDLRTKINAHLKKPGQSQAALARTLASMSSSHNVAANAVGRFLAKKGPRAGATSAVYYTGYIYFEKLRLKQGKNKSKKREEMEQAHGPKGCDTEHDASSGMWVGPGEMPVEDKYGIVTFVPRGRMR